MKPKIGKFRVPKVRLKILLGELNELYKKFGDKTFTVQEFGNTLNISETSSGLQLKISELKNLQLIRAEGDLIKIIDSGTKAIQQNTIERKKEIETIVKRIGLWNELLKFGTALDESNFASTLQKITGLKDGIIKERLKEIIWAFTEDTNCINQFDPNTDYITKKRKIKIIKKPLLKREKPQILPINENKHLISEKIIWKVSSNFGDFQTEILDELSFSNAKNITMQFLDTIERKIMDNKHKKTQT